MNEIKRDVTALPLLKRDIAVSSVLNDLAVRGGRGERVTLEDFQARIIARYVLALEEALRA